MVFGNGCSAPIRETTPLPDRGLPGPRGKNISSRIGSRNPGSTITHQRRPGGDAVFSCDHNDSGLRAPLATLGGGKHPNSRSSNLSVPRGFSRVPISKNAVRLLKSLSCNPSSRSGGLDLNGSYRPGWTREDLATTTVVPPRGSAFAGLSPPAAVSTPDRRVSWGPLPFGHASKSNSGTFRCSASQLGEGCCAQYSTGGLSPVPAGPPTIGSSERMVTRWGPPRTREEAQGWDGISDPPDPFGQPRPSSPPMAPRPALDATPHRGRRIKLRNIPSHPFQQ